MTNLEYFFNKAPFIRLIIPLIIGIGVFDILKYPILPAWALISICFILFLALLLLRKDRYKNEPVFSLILFIIIFLTGCYLPLIHSYKKIEDNSSSIYVATLDNFPEESKKTFKAIIRLQPGGEKVIAYFEKENYPADVEPGQYLAFNKKPHEIENNGNPFEFDYKKYMAYKGVGYRVFLNQDSYEILQKRKKLTLRQHSLIVREYLLKKFKQYGIHDENLHILSAISLGAKENLDPEAKESFAKSGAMHVLAVSGLHVGIIYLILKLLTGYLATWKITRPLRMLIILTGLWSYAFISGLSPSVMRASTMFSVIVIATSLKRNSNIYNTIAASAFILLISNPYNLFNIGFQLSYSAVISIVYIQPKLYQAIYSKYKAVNWLWALTSVSIAAQIGTLPLSLYYFHQFPVYFWLSNLVVIPLVTIILYSAMAFFILSSFSLAGQIIALFLKYICEMLVFVVRYIEKLPFSVIENICLSTVEAFALLGVIVFFMVLISTRSGRDVVVTLSLILILFISSAVKRYNTLTRKEMVVFNLPRKTLTAFINGREATFYTSTEEGLDDYSYYTDPLILHYKINKTYLLFPDKENHLPEQDIRSKGAFINFMGKRILLFYKLYPADIPEDSFPDLDILYISGKHLPGPKLIQKYSKEGIVIFDSSVPLIKSSELIKLSDTGNENIFTTFLGGAVCVKI